MGEIETSLDFDDFEQSTFYQSQQKIATEEEKFKKDLRLDFLTNSPQWRILTQVMQGATKSFTRWKCSIKKKSFPQVLQS